LQAALDGHVLVLAEALIAIAVLTGFVGLLGLASAMSTNVIERTREFAVLHVIGATGPAVRGIVVTEGVLTGALSVLWSVLALTGAAAASAAAARRASRMTVREALTTI
jgi:putative ABC transport system permease protein